MRVLVISVLILISTGKVFSQADYDKQVEYFAADIAKKIPSNKKKIAIVDFRNNDNEVTQLTKLLAEDISAELAIISSSSDVRKFEIVERNNLKVITDDLKISAGGDEAKIARELGKKAIADLLITGVVTLFGDNYKITLKVLDTENGNIITASKASIVKTSALEDLHKKIIGKAVNSESTTNSKAPEQHKVELSATEKNSNGWIDFDNKSFYSLTVYVSTDPGIVNLRSKNLEQLTVPGNSKEKLPALKPGIYYVCASMDNGYSCAITKKVEVKSGEGSSVTLIVD